MDGPDLVKCGDHDLKNYLYCMQCYTDLCAQCYQSHPRNHEVEPLYEALRKIRHRYEPLLENEDLRAVEDVEIEPKKSNFVPDWYQVNEQFVPQILERYQVCVLHPFSDPRWYLNCGICKLKLCCQCFYVNGYTLESAYCSFVQYHNSLMAAENSHEFSEEVFANQ